MNEPIPDRCYDCGGLRRPAGFDQAICRCGKRNIAARFYGAPARDEAVVDAEPVLPPAGFPQTLVPRGTLGRARFDVIERASRDAT